MSTLAPASANLRPWAIMGWLTKFGLKPGMDVYEVGCGTGFVTGQIADYLRGTGSLLSVDIDKDRAAFAANRISLWDNVHVLAADAVTFDPACSFDAIVLPDVLEHIPGRDHGRLFARLADCLHDDGFVFVHLPNPPFLAWLRDRGSDLLQQPYDQPVPTRDLLAAAEPAGLHLHHLETYSIWVPNGDFQAILLRPAAAAGVFREEDG